MNQNDGSFAVLGLCVAFYLIIKLWDRIEELAEQIQGMPVATTAAVGKETA